MAAMCGIPGTQNDTAGGCSGDSTETQHVAKPDSDRGSTQEQTVEVGTTPLDGNEEQNGATHNSIVEPTRTSRVVDKRATHGVRRKHSAKQKLKTRTPTAITELIKVLLVGDAIAGKVEVIRGILHNVLQAESTTDIEGDFPTRSFVINGKSVTVQIWDTTGHSTFRDLPSTYTGGADGVVLVYDTTNYASFESIDEYLKDIQEHTDTNVKKMLVGNISHQNNLRAVPVEEAECFAENNNISLIEFSKEDPSRMEDAFKDFVTEIYKKRHNQMMN